MIPQRKNSIPAGRTRSAGIFSRCGAHRAAKCPAARPGVPHIVKFFKNIRAACCGKHANVVKYNDRDLAEEMLSAMPRRRFRGRRDRAVRPGHTGRERERDMKKKGRIAEKLRENRFIAAFMDHYSVRTAVFSLLSLLINVGFATVYLVSAILYRSVWYAAMAGYNGCLILFRFLVNWLNWRRRKKYAVDREGGERAKWRIYLVSGALLMPLVLAMSVAVTYMVLWGRPSGGGMIITIATAAYTFYKMVMASVHLSVSKKRGDPVSMALRKLNFADACMSFVSMTELLLRVFGDGTDDGTFSLAMEAVVGFAACVTVVAMAAVMIITAARKLGLPKEDAHLSKAPAPHTPGPKGNGEAATDVPSPGQQESPEATQGKEDPPAAPLPQLPANPPGRAADRP